MVDCDLQLNFKKLIGLLITIEVVEALPQLKKLWRILLFFLE